MDFVFNKSDFESLNYSFIFENQTSGTACREYRSVKILAFNKNGLSMRVLSNSCNLKHQLTLLGFKGQRPKIPRKITWDHSTVGVDFIFIASVKSKKVCEHDPLFCEVQLELTQVESKSWKKFQEEYRERQKSLNKFFQKVAVQES